MNSITSPVVTIQTSPQSVPSTPSWLGEVALVVHHLTSQGVLESIAEQVRFVRRRFGHYEVIDFVAVLMGYALSGEPTLEAFYERLWPFALPFMALFGRKRLPHRSTLSRFLAAIDQPIVEACSFSPRSAGAASHAGRRTSRRSVGSTGNAVVGLRRRWDPTSSPRASLTSHVGSASSPPTLRAGLRARIDGAQTCRSGAYSHDHSSSTYSSVAGELLWRRKWGVSWRTSPCNRGHRRLSGQSAPPTGSRYRTTRWAVWQRSHYRGSRRSGAGLHRAWQGLRPARPAPDTSSPGPAT